MGDIALLKWRGPRDAEAIDPAKVEFRAIRRPGTSCKGCHFERQWSEVCTVAMAEAVKRGLPACNDGVIYLKVEKDPRQLDAIVAESEGA